MLKSYFLSQLLFFLLKFEFFILNNLLSNRVANNQVIIIELRLGIFLAYRHIEAVHAFIFTRLCCSLPLQRVSIGLTKIVEQGRRHHAQYIFVYYLAPHLLLLHCAWLQCQAYIEVITKQFENEFGQWHIALYMCSFET